MMQLTTERLILRAFRMDDFAAVHAYASTIENTVYMPFGPNSEGDTRAFLEKAVACGMEEPCRQYEFAVALRDSGEVIGGCDLILTSPGTGEIGWILRRDFWRQSYGAELGRALLQFGFDELRLHRITAVCDAENAPSWGLMEKLGMRREACFLDARRGNKLSDKPYGDELRYAILRDEWEIQREVAYYNALPCAFFGFVEVPELAGGDIYLVCTQKKPADPEKKYVPAYQFAICRGGEKIGNIGLRVGYTDGLYYGGQIGYDVYEPFRGRGYAAEACHLVLPIARAHKMEKLLITNAEANAASRRVCEKLGARRVRLARLPEWTELYRDGLRYVNIFELAVP